jgi:hypothetical protein
MERNSIRALYENTASARCSMFVRPLGGKLVVSTSDHEGDFDDAQKMWPRRLFGELCCSAFRCSKASITPQARRRADGARPMQFIRVGIFADYPECYLRHNLTVGWSKVVVKSLSEVSNGAICQRKGVCGRWEKGKEHREQWHP